MIFNFRKIINFGIYLLIILVPANEVEKIKYLSTLLGLIFIEITGGPLVVLLVGM